MIIQCDQCTAKFKLNEDRIKGKGARVKCRKCGEYIIVMKPEFEHLKSQFTGSVKAKELVRDRAGDNEKKEVEQGEESIPQAEEGAYEMEMTIEKEYMEAGEEGDEEKPLTTIPPVEAPGKKELPPDEPPIAAPAELPSEEETIGGPLHEPTVSAPRDGVEEESPKDDIDIAFEKFLGSLREESQISVGEFQAPDTEDPGTEDVSVEKLAGEKFGEVTPVDMEKEPGVSEEEERPDIIGTTEALEFISKEKEQDKGEDKEFDLKLEDEQLVIDSSFDISDQISSDQKIVEEDSGETLEVPFQTTYQAEVETEDPYLGGEAVRVDTGGDIADISMREKSAPFEYVPKDVARSRKKSKLAGFLFALLIFLILIAGAGAYLAFTKGGNEIVIQYAPYVQSMIGEKPMGLSSKYDIINLIGYHETNKHAGKIFVIKGEMVNLSGSVSSGLVLKGEILNEKNDVISEKEVYAGNTIELKTLRNAPVKTIEESLQNKLGKNLSNIDIQPGSSVPFMIVFFNLQEKVEAYKVESPE